MSESRERYYSRGVAHVEVNQVRKLNLHESSRACIHSQVSIMHVSARVVFAGAIAVLVQSSANVPEGVYCGVAARFDNKVALTLEFDRQLQQVSISLGNDRAPVMYEEPIECELYHGVVVLDDYDNGFSRFLRDQFSMPMTSDRLVQIYDDSADAFDVTLILSDMMTWDMRLSKQGCRAPLLGGAYSTSDASVLVRFDNRANMVHVLQFSDDGSEHGGEFDYTVTPLGEIVLSAGVDGTVPDVRLQLQIDSDVVLVEHTNSSGVRVEETLLFGNMIMSALEEVLDKVEQVKHDGETDATSEEGQDDDDGPFLL